VSGIEWAVSKCSKFVETDEEEADDEDVFKLTGSELGGVCALLPNGPEANGGAALAK
jgi:hypothetical protein